MLVLHDDGLLLGQCPPDCSTRSLPIFSGHFDFDRSDAGRCNGKKVHLLPPALQNAAQELFQPNAQKSKRINYRCAA